VVVPLIVELDVDAGLLVVVGVCVVVLLEQPIRLMLTTAIMHTTPMRMVNLFLFIFLPPVLVTEDGRRSGASGTSRGVFSRQNIGITSYQA